MELIGSFVTKIISAFGDEGKEWLETLDSSMDTILTKWNLISEGPVDNLSYNYVLKVKDNEGNPFILKLGVPNFDFSNEIRTLKEYGGRGCAQLLKADPEQGAMLLEQVIPGNMLFVVEDEKLAIEHFAHVWKSIRTPIVDSSNYPTVLHWSDGINRYLQEHLHKEDPFSHDLLKAAQTYFNEIADSSIGQELLHGDLHHENILYSEEHGWMAIDPKGVVGDPYFDCTSFLINHLFEQPNPKYILEKRVDMLCHGLGLERDRLLKASVAMATLYACWGIEDKDNEGAMNSYQCAKWFEEFRG